MPNQETLSRLAGRESLEVMSPDDIANSILKDGETIGKIERRMNLASDVLKAVYGLTVEEVLKKREDNAETKVTSP